MIIRRFHILLAFMLLAGYGCRPSTGVDEPVIETPDEKPGNDEEPGGDTGETPKPGTDSTTVFEPLAGMTVYGRVCSESGPVDGVLVSDGIDICLTDSSGYYQMKSAKKLGYVFISLPSGYSVESKGVFPQFYSNLTQKESVAERHDFTLASDSEQEQYEMMVLGDMQLADRSDDLDQFRHFTNELNTYVRQNPSRKVYALTLGDMAWDTHWEKYDLTNYVKDINRLTCGIQVFHAIGNHDHESTTVGEMGSSATFRKVIGPTYYSFNIGKVHYLMLDSVYSTNDGSGETSYEDKIDDDQMEWLKMDLSFVSRETPLFVVLHTPIFKDSGKNSLDNADDLVKMLSAYDKVLVQSGHTHILYNVDNNSKHIIEQNSGAICATWWYTGYDVPWLHIGRDGSPGGYRICSVDGSDISWTFKGIEKPLDYQFRSYDRNQICFTTGSDTPNADSAHKTNFQESWGEYGTASSENYVYLNIWDYDPSWKIEVKEGDKTLDVKQFEGLDPLHVLAYNAKRSDINKSLSFPTKATKHLFKVKAGSSNTTLEITVTDRFGRKYHETMTRPKPFTLEEYMK